MKVQTKLAIWLLAATPGAVGAVGWGDIVLRSSLNAPLDAEIGITATAEEMNGLRAGLASRDTFTHNGLEYPSFLGSATVSVVKTGDGRDALRVRTTDPVTEPFVTMLVEINYARGKLMREFTVLLDPPVLGARVNAAPVAAPAVTAPQRSGSLQPAAPAVPASSAPPPAATAGAGSTYQVQRGDSLSRLVLRQLPTVEPARAMVGVYRNNPAAFDGNMNELRAGAVLNLPTEAQLTSLPPAEASAEVSRQYRAWSSARAGGRLRLVPPGEGGGGGDAATTGAGTAGDSGAALQQQITDLQKELAETKRLLELRNAELARLQQQARTGAGPAQPPPAASPAAEPAAEASPAPAPVEEPGPLDSLLENWQLLAGGAVLIVGLLGLAVFQRRKQHRPDSGRDFDRFGSSGAFERSAASSQTLPPRTLPAEADTASIVVEESGARQRATIGAIGAAAATDVGLSLESGSHPAMAAAEDTDATGTMQSLAENASALEAGDPLAEADFHMAYGLYDQAAELVKKAIAQDGERRDLKVKLLEVYFVWGNRDEFLKLARELAKSRDPADTGEWDKILIMGRQIAADDELFVGEGGLTGTGHGGVDLNLEGGQNRVDFNVMGEPTLSPTETHAIDLDFGEAAPALADSAHTQQLTSDSGVDFMLDDPLRGAETAEDAGEASDLATRLQPLDMDLDAELQGEAPTKRMQALEAAELGTIRQKLDRGTGTLPALGAMAPAEQTAELALDDLGLDLGTMEVPAASVAEADSHGMLDIVLETSETPTTDLDVGAATGGWQLPGEATGTHNAGLTVSGGMPEFDHLLADVNGHAEPEHGVEPAGSATPPQSDISLPAAAATDSDPPTMSEVGTKLDLARAYMDMGDPEGARSILDEVLLEGSSSQKTEARRLLESLPG